MVGICFYFVGLSGCGKTTLVRSLQTIWKTLLNKHVDVIDGDDFRARSSNCDFSKRSRSLNVRSIGHSAFNHVSRGDIVLVSNIAPYHEDREYNRKLISQCGVYVELYLDIPLHVCESRDVKGLYRNARLGVIKNLTGISDPFEIPINPEVVIPLLTKDQTVEYTWNKINKYI